METVGDEERVFIPPKFNLLGISLKLIKSNRLLQKVVQSTYINYFMHLWIVKSRLLCKSILALIMTRVAATVEQSPEKLYAGKRKLWQTRTNMKSPGLVYSVYVHFLVCIWLNI